MAARMEPKQRTGFMNSLRLVWNNSEANAVPSKLRRYIDAMHMFADMSRRERLFRDQTRRKTEAPANATATRTGCARIASRSIGLAEVKTCGLTIDPAAFSFPRERRLSGK
jgi:hypothetical protein